jgi:hypothetical protein
MAVELSLASILSHERSKLTKVNVDHQHTQSEMKDVDDVWWCRTPKNSVVYGSGERRIAVSGVSRSAAYRTTTVLYTVLLGPGKHRIWLPATLPSLEPVS